jgi:peptidoglycan-associated lipoprotein
MKSIKFANLLVVALVLSVAAVGCKKKPTNVTPLPNQGSMVGGAGPAGSDVPGGGSLGGDEPVPFGGDQAAFDLATEDRQAFAADTVYFDFDSSLVKSSEQGKVDRVAGALMENMSHLLRIEGHCDERGTEGYNLALGERRALALREALVAAGVGADRIQTISYGEERPADPNHDEIAWSKNRRGEFILLIP